MRKFLAGVLITSSSLLTLAAGSLDFPALPKAITSFGACSTEGFVYVYGGHSGKAHHYSVTTTEFGFYRVSMDAPAVWEALPGPVRVQGTSLIPWQDRLIRVGGLAVHSPEGAEKEQLVSLDSAALFHPVEQRWESLPPLPAARSSHDSIIVDHTLYVLGGWRLNGPRKGQWYDEAWSLNLKKPETGWKRFDQPFRRRAVAVAAREGRILVMGGMDSENDTSREVDIYDVASGQWSQGPKLPDGPMDGFGASACLQGDTIYASTYAGKIFALKKEATAWETVVELKQRRFFHRMVPLPGSRLLLIAGASRKTGHLDSLEVVELKGQ